MAASIKTHICCRNIAPFENLDSEINSSTLKIGIFANNGSGKTFISRLFRLLESNYENVVPAVDDTNHLLRLGKSSGYFGFSVKDKSGYIVDDVALNINLNQETSIPLTQYLYHTFNQDYVDENIRSLDYEKDSNITGYILGKVNIDLSEDERKLQEISDKGKALKTEVENYVTKFVSEKIDPIANITRLQEYKEKLNTNYILSASGIIDGVPQLEASIEDYNKVKAIPENLLTIKDVILPDIDWNLIDEIFQILSTEYSVNTFALDFKNEIRSKQDFIEKGLQLMSDTKTVCPFCKQELGHSAEELIDKYTEFLKDAETKAIALIKQKSSAISTLSEAIERTKENIDKQRIKFDEYKIKYIPSLRGEKLIEIDFADWDRCLSMIAELLQSKQLKLQDRLTLDASIVETIKTQYSRWNDIIETNNQAVEKLNKKINNSAEENKRIRKQICLSASNYLIETIQDKLQDIRCLRTQYSSLSKEIAEKREKAKTTKKDVVADTICKVLDSFFKGKYSLNRESFQLTFNSSDLAKGQVSKVLSDGEKSVIAFAYYLGDIHLKINRDDDYDKVFLIIDDPISSMDFSFVYTVSGVIRDLKLLIPHITHEKYIILTHNNDFMRIISENKIIDKSLHLTQNKLEPLNINFAVPYISHLIDVYKVANSLQKPTHTTANSIRHIIETLTKFNAISVSEDSIAGYIHENIPQDNATFTLINDLSHGGWRSEQQPISEQDYVAICNTIIEHIRSIYPKQIDYCTKTVQ